MEPPKLYYDASGRLHRDGGPAVEYRSGYGCYYLHGCRVEKKLAMAWPDELDASLVITADNEELKQALLQKIGWERVVKQLKPKTLDTRDGYGLIEFDFAVQGQKVRALKMVNPSTGQTHVEPVPPDCPTVDMALKFRNGTTDKPEVLT